MQPQLLKLLNLAFVGPILIRMADGKKLHPYQRHALRAIGWTTLTLNLYGLWTQYQQNKSLPIVTQLIEKT